MHSLVSLFGFLFDLAVSPVTFNTGATLQGINQRNGIMSAKMGLWFIVIKRLLTLQHFTMCSYKATQMEGNVKQILGDPGFYLFLFFPFSPVPDKTTDTLSSARAITRKICAKNANAIWLSSNSGSEWDVFACRLLKSNFPTTLICPLTCCELCMKFCTQFTSLFIFRIKHIQYLMS